MTDPAAPGTDAIVDRSSRAPREGSGFPDVLAQQGAAIGSRRDRPASAKQAGDGDADPPAAASADTPEATLTLIVDSAALSFIRFAPQEPAIGGGRSALRGAAQQADSPGRPRAADGRRPLLREDGTAAPLRHAMPPDGPSGGRFAPAAANGNMGTAPDANHSPDTTAAASNGRPAALRPMAFQDPSPRSAVRALAVAPEDIAPPAPQALAATGAHPDAALAGLGAPGAAASTADGSIGSAPTIVTPLDQPRWPQEFAAEVTRLAQALPTGHHTIRLHVNPPELGPVHITLQVGDATTQASFVSPHAHVRHALENALGDLQQQFAQAGLSLGQASVGDQQAGQGGFLQEQLPFPSAAGTTGAAADNLAQVPPVRGRPAPPHPDALVDTFA